MIKIQETFVPNFAALKNLDSGDIYLVNYTYRDGIDYRKEDRGGMLIRIRGVLHEFLSNEENVSLTLELEKIQDNPDIVHYDPDTHSFVANYNNHKFIRPLTRDCILGDHIIIKNV